MGFDFEQWNYAFTNTFTEEEARRAYQRYAIPAPGGIVWRGVLANFQPGHQFSHLLPGQRGWEEVADHALEWTVTHAV